MSFSSIVSASSLTSAVMMSTATAGSGSMPASTSFSVVDADKPSNATGFVGSSAFYFVVVGIPVIILVIACILAGCCCCCTGLSYKAIRQRRRQRRQDAFFGHNNMVDPTKHNTPPSPSVEKIVPSHAELQAPPALHTRPHADVSELHGSMEEAPPGYEVANRQRGVVDESGYKYHVGADRRV